METAISCTRRLIVLALASATAPASAEAQPAGAARQASHAVRIPLVEAERMRREVLDRLSGATRPEILHLREALAQAAPWLDRGGQLHYGPWQFGGGGQAVSLTAAFPPDGPLGLPRMGNPGLHATFERQAGHWRLTRIDEASTTR